MLKRIIPSSSELLPVIGVGTWQQFDVDISGSRREPLSEVLQLMMQSGGTLIDTSPMYGKAEQVIGELTEGFANKDDFFYATKVWTSGAQEGIKQMESSMQKMKRETMDLIQVHNLVDYKTHLRTLKQWKEEGKVRYIGVTHYQVSAHEELEKIIKSEKPDFVQFNYSIRVRNAEKSLLHTAKDNGVAVIINEPLEKGSLFNLVKGKQLPEWCADYDIKSWVQFFLKYILSHEAVNCVIPATSNPAHLLENVGAGQGAMPDKKIRLEMLEFINAL
jgi:diketogulonate reductase-like aldo/keto reductase